jgi:hypothetical protein
MQQRVGLARALASDPSILLMDEAFSALDPIIRTEMQLLRLQEIKRRTIVFISHDLDEAMRIGDRIAIMKDGMVQQVGTPDEILRNPANDYVRTFIQGVDAAAVFKASDIARQALTVISEHSDRGCRAALRLLEDSDRDYAYVLNARKRFLGVVSSQSLRDALHGHDGMLGLKHAFISDVQPIASSTPVAELFGTVATPAYPLPVVDEDGSTWALSVAPPCSSSWIAPPHRCRRPRRKFRPSSWISTSSPSQHASCPARSALKEGADLNDNALNNPNTETTSAAFDDPWAAASAPATEPASANVTSSAADADPGLPPMPMRMPAQVPMPGAAEMPPARPAAPTGSAPPRPPMCPSMTAA